MSMSPIMTPMEETTWKSIPGYDGYLVSADGRVWGNYRNREMQLRPNWAGYMQVGLYAPDGTVIKHLVHRLVLLAFVGPCPDGMEACHANGLRADNRIENLRWDTKQANMVDQRRHGTLVKGQRQGSSKLTDDQAREVKRRLGEGESQRSIATEYGITQAAVSLIATGKNWAWL